MYVNSVNWVRIKGCKSEWFRIDSGLRQGCTLSSWFLNGYTDILMKVKMGMGRMGMRLLEGRVWRLPSLLYPDDLVLCGKSEEGLRVNTDKYCDGSWRGGWIGMYMTVIFLEIQVLEICVR